MRLSGITKWVRESSPATKAFMVATLAVVAVSIALVCRLLFPAATDTLPEYGADDAEHNVVDWGDDSGEPQVALSYVNIDEDSLDLWFAQRNCEDVSVSATLVDSRGEQVETQELRYQRGDALSTLRMSFAMDGEEYASIADVEFACEGAIFDDSRLSYLLGNAKRERALHLEAERLASLDAERSDARAEAEAADAEAEAARIRAEEGARTAEEARPGSSVSEHVSAPPQAVSHVPDGWAWGEAYYDLVLTCAETNGSQTSHFVCNDLAENRVTVLSWNGSGWAAERWFVSNLVACTSGLTPKGLFRVTTKAPADSNGSYHEGGAGFDDWMVAYRDSYALEDSVSDGHHLRYVDGAGWWSATGFCHGYDLVWYDGTGDGGDGQTYLELDDAQWLYDHVEIGSSVLNF